jgi:hypothetical protein
MGDSRDKLLCKKLNSASLREKKTSVSLSGRNLDHYLPGQFTLAFRPFSSDLTFSIVQVMRILAYHVGDIIMNMRWRQNWGSWFMDDVHLTKLNWSHKKWGFVISRNHTFRSMRSPTFWFRIRKFRVSVQKLLFNLSNSWSFAHGAVIHLCHFGPLAFRGKSVFACQTNSIWFSSLQRGNISALLCM